MPAAGSGGRNSGGAQTVHRAVDVLRFLATGGPDGWSLGDVVSAADLTKGTAHRLLAALMADDLVEQEPSTRRYRLRVDLLGLRRDLDWYQPLRQLVAPMLRQLADELGDTVFLSVRSGFDALCIACELGGFPIRTFPYDEGERRPLGVGASGLAMLGALDQANVDRVLSFNRGRLRAHKNFSPPELLVLVEQTRKRGYSVIDGLIVPGMVAVGIVFNDPTQRPNLALSAAGIADRMPRSRWPEIVAALHRGRENMEKMVRADMRHAGAQRPSPRRPRTA
ncbi:MAG: IclR family transcriptional regulator [Alphaproteobacteria bacterium]|nr:IclR family transcriptional regulator [Alphaproteobacteria bacterium]